MGIKLVQYYDMVEKKEGLPGKMRLAMKTNVPSNKAKEVPDDPATLDKFHAAVKEILGPNTPKL